MTDWARKTERKRDICTFDYSLRVTKLSHVEGCLPKADTAPILSRQWRFFRTLECLLAGGLSLTKSSLGVTKLPHGEGCLGGHIIHTNTLPRLTMTTLSVSSVTWCLDVGFKAEICIKEVEITSLWSPPTVIDWAKKTQRRRDICTFDYSLRVTNLTGRVVSQKQTLRQS